MTDIANITEIANIADIANRIRRSDFEYYKGKQVGRLLAVGNLLDGRRLG